MLAEIEDYNSTIGRWKWVGLFIVNVIVVAAIILTLLSILSNRDLKTGIIREEIPELLPEPEAIIIDWVPEGGEKCAG